jgi:hypothetical protein
VDGFKCVVDGSGARELTTEEAEQLQAPKVDGCAYKYLHDMDAFYDTPVGRLLLANRPKNYQPRVGDGALSMAVATGSNRYPPLKESTLLIAMHRRYGRENFGNGDTRYWIGPFSACFRASTLGVTARVGEYGFDICLRRPFVSVTARHREYGYQF